MSRSIYSGLNYEKVYNFNNYLIEYDENNKESNLCVIYCSSSGIYYPNTEEAFENAFIREKNKFEWRNHKINRAFKHIWIRDITKEFYVRGINYKINSIDKLIDFMRVETKGYRIITIGSSAGGYIAALLGSVLNGECVYCFSGYYNLHILDKLTWPLIYSEDSIRENGKYYNLRSFIEQSSTTVLYFYPGKLSGDRKQAENVKKLSNVHSYILNSKVHGIPFGDRDKVDYIINMEYSDLISKLKKVEGQIIFKFIWDRIMN